MNRSFHRPQGFTLAELAVVLAIVGLLLGGLLVPLTAQYDLRRRQETEKSLADIREALLGFAAINGRLPCPAPPGIPTGNAGAGIEATTAAISVTATSGPCGCTAATGGVVSAGGVACSDTSPTGSLTGVLPWATLGLPETDAWGNRYSYRVTTRYARLAAGQTDFGCVPAANPTAAAFALCTAGDIKVSSAALNGAAIAVDVPAIVVSHGKNGYGAYTPTGSQLPASADSDEAENGNGDAAFVGNPSLDDQLTWVSASVLKSRMLAAGRLP